MDSHLSPKPTAHTTAPKPSDPHTISIGGPPSRKRKTATNANQDPDQRLITAHTSNLALHGGVVSTWLGERHTFYHSGPHPSGCQVHAINMAVGYTLTTPQEVLAWALHRASTSPQWRHAVTASAEISDDCMDAWLHEHTNLSLAHAHTCATSANLLRLLNSSTSLCFIGKFDTGSSGGHCGCVQAHSCQPPLVAPRPFN